MTETNDIDSREEVYELRLDEKEVQESTFYMKAKFKRIQSKKGYDEDEYAMDIL